MKYRIGVVAELLGISQEGLRLYERSGILDTQRESGSGKYRTYSHLDITALLRARDYHNTGFTLQEIERMINTDQIGVVRDKYADRREVLREKIRREQLMAEHLDTVVELIDALPAELGVIRVEQRPAMYRFEYVKEDELLLTPDQYAEFRRWVNLTPFTFSAARNSWEAICRGEETSFSALGILAEHAKVFDIHEGGGVSYHAPCRCLYTVVRLQGDAVRATEYLHGLLSYTLKNGIRVTGDPLTFVSMNKRKDYTRYRQIWLPIEQPTPAEGEKTGF